METGKVIFLLVGPKGSGKSFIGRLFHRHFGISFVHVEDWVRALPRPEDIKEEDFIQQAFATIESGILRELKSQSALVFESTGLSDHFDRMLVNLRQHAVVVGIRITADAEVCVRRVLERDPEKHVPISEANVREINRLVDEKEHDFPYLIDNSSKTADELSLSIEFVLKHLSQLPS